MPDIIRIIGWINLSWVVHISYDREENCKILFIKSEGKRSLWRSGHRQKVLNFILKIVISVNCMYLFQGRDQWWASEKNNETLGHLVNCHFRQKAYTPWSSLDFFISKSPESFLLVDRLDSFLHHVWIWIDDWHIQEWLEFPEVFLAEHVRPTICRHGNEEHSSRYMVWWCVLALIFGFYVSCARLPVLLKVAKLETRFLVSWSMKYC